MAEDGSTTSAVLAYTGFPHRQLLPSLFAMLAALIITVLAGASTVRYLSD